MPIRLKSGSHILINDCSLRWQDAMVELCPRKALTLVELKGFQLAVEGERSIRGQARVSHTKVAMSVVQLDLTRVR